MTCIPRRSEMTEESFIDECLKASQPVIVTDAMTDWRALREWGPPYLAAMVGETEVQVYDDLFTLTDVEKLSSYLVRNFAQSREFSSTEYVRAYARFKDVDFAWADSLFEALARDWGHPYFFPRGEFILPYSPPGNAISPVSHVFPYKGLFISGRGARTRLHRDPFGTDAVLCQFYGEKRVLFFHPCHAEELMSDGAFVDPAAVDRERFPKFETLQPHYDDVLRPGEILFIPGGWFHDVSTLSDSISITWNFVHCSRPELFRRETDNARNIFDRDMLAFLGQSS